MENDRMAAIKTAGAFRSLLDRLGLELPFDEVVESGADSPLAAPLRWSGGVVGNRFAILPMEGWDGTADGRPSELTIRRWTRFGQGGAKLIWGGEAVAVVPEGRANPNQLVINDANVGDLIRLREALVAAHVGRFGSADDLQIGLQLTHSGRFCKPDVPRPKIAYRHPLLDRKFGLRDDHPVLTDDELRGIVRAFVEAARLAEAAGFAFVDVKHCHGYLGHELLSAVDRPGPYGGSLENRSRLLREVVEGVRGLDRPIEVGIRLSVVDFLPFEKGDDGVGRPMSPHELPYRLAFGGDAATGLLPNLAEPSALLGIAESLGIRWICTTAGCAYYNPHLTRPAAFPPSDGYLPPEHPLVGVARQIAVTAELKRRHPGLIFVGSGYSFLQDWLPNVAQAAVRSGGADFAGLGRMALSYPELPADVLAGRPLARKQICRTFSDCTTAPRAGMASGCYPLDPFYKDRPGRERLRRPHPGPS